MKYRWLAKHWIGSTALGLATATALHWFGVLTHGMFDYWWTHGREWVLDWFDLVTCAVLLSLIFWVAWMVQRFARSSLAVSRVDAHGHQALVLFLSLSLRPNEELEDKDGQETGEWVGYKRRFAPLVDDFAKRLRAGESPSKAGEAFGRETWCMPMVGVAHQAAGGGHGKVIRAKVAITSADSGALKNGTWRQAEFFREMISRLFEQWGRPKCCPRISFRPERGVDFYDLAALSKEVEACYAQLSQEGVRDVIIDVTGGTKECSIAGAAHALEPGRVFQYVSTHDRDVGHYDLTYQPARAGSHVGH